MRYKPGKLGKASDSRDQSRAHKGLVARDGTTESRTYPLYTRDYRTLLLCVFIIEGLGIAQ